jgi:hypothetical protein
MTPDALDKEIAALLNEAALPAARDRRPVRTWALSTVQRVILADGQSVICKYATRPFTNEAAILRALANAT